MTSTKATGTEVVHLCPHLESRNDTVQDATYIQNNVLHINKDKKTALIYCFTFRKIYFTPTLLVYLVFWNMPCLFSWMHQSSELLNSAFMTQVWRPGAIYHFRNLQKMRHLLQGGVWCESQWSAGRATSMKKNVSVIHSRSSSDRAVSRTSIF